MKANKGVRAVYCWYARGVKFQGMPWAHNPERVTAMLGLRHGVFTDQFIFRYILEHFFPPLKWELRSCYERIRNTMLRYGRH